VRLTNADQFLFDGDLDQARQEYMVAYAASADPEIRAAALWGLARVEYQSGNQAQSLDDLRQMLSAYPESENTARAYFLQGEIYTSLSRYPEAAGAYTTYLKLRPGVIDYEVQLRLGDAYDAAANYPNAITAYQAALAAPHLGDDTSLKINIAQAYASSGDSTTALSLYDQISTASSDDYVKAQVDLLEGQIYLALGQKDQAYQHFLDTVNNYPTSYDSYSALVALVNAGVPVDDLNRGLTDYFAGQYGNALDAFNRFTLANPQNDTTNPEKDGTVQYYHAMTELALGNYQQAVDEFSAFINLFPSNKHWEDAWNNKSDTQWAYLNQIDAAAQTLLDYVKAAPSSPDVPQFLLTAGRMYERANQLDDAAHVWEGIADAYPSSDLVTEALLWAGLSQYRNKEYAAALLTFQRETLLAATPEDQSQAFFWIGKTQVQKGDSAAAQTAWQQAASLDPTGYYSVRAGDLLFNRGIFASPSDYSLSYDLAAERPAAEAWIRVKFNLDPSTDLSTPGALLSDPRLIRGTELWNLGLFDEARTEFEDLRQSVSSDPANSYRLTNYLLDLGLYRSAILAARQVLTLAGMQTSDQTLAAPIFFNHVRYGLYYQELVLPAAQQNGFDPLLLFAVIRQESLFEGFVNSTAGARGLMQIVPSTGQTIAKNMNWPPNYTDADLYRPLVSIDMGAHYLKSIQDYLNGDLYDALAGYNAGPGNAQIWQQLAGGDPDLFLEIVRYDETRTYIRSVFENYGMYRLLYGTMH
jgi:soluble lytic murein transglycosylase